MSNSFCRFCHRDNCGIVELNRKAPKEVLDFFTDPKMHLKDAYKVYNFQTSQQKMMLEHKLQRNARMHEECEAVAKENKACRDRLNQLKQAESEMDQQIASREAEIERLKALIRRDGNDDLSGGSMFSDLEEIDRGRRVEELFQKLGSPSPYPHQGGFAGSSSQLSTTRGSEGDESFFRNVGKFSNMMTPVTCNKRRTRKRRYTKQTLSHEGKFLNINTPAAWPKRQETGDWAKASPTNFFSP